MPRGIMHRSVKLTLESSSFMQIPFPHNSGIYLKLAPVAHNQIDYPTSQLQKGLVLVVNGEELVEEGVGFGVPVLKQGLKTIFPGAIQLADWKQDQELTAVYHMNLEERLAGQNQRVVENQLLYRLKDYLAEAYRRYPAMRRWLTTLSNGMRHAFNWQTSYENAGWDYPVRVHYTFDWQSSLVSVEVDVTALPQEDVTEVVVMNEQGAHHFDTYSDSSGVRLHGGAIGSWEQVTAESASFLSHRHGVAFTLPQLEGARLFRGRELVGSRLAWAGFGYSFSLAPPRIAYSLQIKRLS